MPRAGITQMYAVDNNVCPDGVFSLWCRARRLRICAASVGLPHEPKFSHLGNLHRVLAENADLLVGNPAQVTVLTRKMPPVWLMDARVFCSAHAVAGQRGAAPLVQQSNATLRERHATARLRVR